MTTTINTIHTINTINMINTTNTIHFFNVYYPNFMYGLFSFVTVSDVTHNDRLEDRRKVLAREMAELDHQEMERNGRKTVLLLGSGGTYLCMV